MKILIDEEYGYRFWEFDFPGDKDKLIRWWKGLPSVKPLFFDPSNLLKRVGKIKEMDDEEIEGGGAKDYEVILHLHDDSDSYCHDRVMGVFHHHKGFVKRDLYLDDKDAEVEKYIAEFV